MLKYNKLEATIITFDNEDIITTSGNSSDLPDLPGQPQPQPGGQDGIDSNIIV